MPVHVALDERQIVAIGGSLSKMPVGAVAMMEYLITLTRNRDNPRILVMNTATGDADSTKLFAYEVCSKVSSTCALTFLGFFARTPMNLSELLLSQDIIFVNGGNTKSMLAVWREYGVDKLLAEAWASGIVLAGSSAGGICWFDSCCTDSFADRYIAMPALGILSGSCCPHYDGESGRRASYHGMITGGELASGFAIDEGTGIHFKGTEIHKIVSVSPRVEAAAYRVTGEAGGRVKEEVLAAIRLLDYEKLELTN
jgi:peptidase E